MTSTLIKTPGGKFGKRNRFVDDGANARFVVSINFGFLTIGFTGSLLVRTTKWSLCLESTALTITSHLLFWSKLLMIYISLVDSPSSIIGVTFPKGHVAQIETSRERTRQCRTQAKSPSQAVYAFDYFVLFYCRIAQLGWLELRRTIWPILPVYLKNKVILS